MFSFFVCDANEYMFRIALRDKGDSIYLSGLTPDLSDRALLRREKFGISIDIADYPVNALYINKINKLGFGIVVKSRWMNTLVVSTDDSSNIGILNNLPFVLYSKFVWSNLCDSICCGGTGIKSSSFFMKNKNSNLSGNKDLMHLGKLHKKGYNGQGMFIAVIDGGFKWIDSLSSLSNAKITGERNFVHASNNSDVSLMHGTAVMSVLAGNSDDINEGTAPGATYCLLVSENGNSETPVEEDYWVAAAEYADSIGADIITSSLGYTKWTSKMFSSYTHKDLDGNSAYISHIAGVAAKKGILVVISAGNEGNRKWRKVCFPADSRYVLSVGSIDLNGKISDFSSLGPTFDGRIKPDVVMQGTLVKVIQYNNSVPEFVNGTSYSTPAVAGMAACLWQAMPYYSNFELMNIIKRGSSNAFSPDTVTGYGIPDADKIWKENRR